MSIVVAQSLTRRYGKRRGIEQVELNVLEGSMFGFLGPNGAGKSTTIRVLMGFLRASGGSARIFGMDCWSQGRKIRQDVGYVPGDLRLHSWMNATDALRIFGAIRGRDMAKPGRDLIEQFGLDAKVKVRAMSRGMKQKLGLILALAHRPRLLVLDEPTTGLDPLMQERFRAHLQHLVAAGHTVFFSSHTLSEVEQLCDHVAIVRDGRIVADQPLEALRQRAGHEVTIRWKGNAHADAIQPPEFLQLTSRQGFSWSGTLEGPVERLVAWLAKHPVEDLAIGRPDLETLFRRFYQQDRGGT
jgi:ABC-2 type transport system ATP-binding protein